LRTAGAASAKHVLKYVIGFHDTEINRQLGLITVSLGGARIHHMALPFQVFDF
jgi:hypothetical protein